MAKPGWHILRDDRALTLARHLPVRLDVCASAVLPDGRRLAVAQQVRQDMWRLLRDLRGFSPVVRVERADGALCVTAGGRAARPIPPGTQSRIAALLANPALRARWTAQARKHADA